ncbi:hypothetical protein OM076_08690 [Solirubrobacter ginsenosidimutans]|uniref:Uncharacterized protein n=1 Tax=Solirubrobacter ginsenosidimutans TaxID=490573 RepID=A0A9X3MPL9_9ACTN|nr:hypothetical protein [Solirubrobacter ginsenosidimutans]MDA0160339.1 hypothetical protein [Solirubrobacter ginsenosidimutans]
MNLPEHGTRDKAFRDMVTTIERGFYWKQSQLPDVPRWTQMIGMGSHGGRGLFIVGVTTNDEWEAEPDGDVFKHRLPVAWARVIYENPSALQAVKAVPSRFNERFGAELSHKEYRQIVQLVLDGEALDMDVGALAR